MSRDAREALFSRQVAAQDLVTPGFSERFAVLCTTLLALGGKLVAPPTG